MHTSPQSSQVVHIEGLDLAGKSTAANALVAYHREADLRRNALTLDNRIFTLADQLRREGTTSARILGPMYVAAVLHDLASYTPPARFTVQDSTVLLRSLAYNTAIGNIGVVAQLLELLPEHPRFGVSVVLTASIESRLERLDRRFRDSPDEVAPDDLAVRTNPERFVQMEAVLIDLATRYFGAQVVDTSAMTREEVAEGIIELVRGPK